MFGATSAPVIGLDAVDNVWSKGLVALLVRRGSPLLQARTAKGFSHGRFLHTAWGQQRFTLRTRSWC